MCKPDDEIIDARSAPEVFLAKMLKDDLGVEVNPQALRMFIRAQWGNVSACAHKIHKGN